MPAVCRKGNPLASQSGISRMINDLEKEWGFSLLERCHTGVRLTGAGEKLLPYAQHFCDGYMDLQSEVDALRGARTGKIRIGVFSSVATHWIPAVIKAFQHDYPLVDYELLLGDYKEIEEWIRSGRVDCGFLITSVASDLETIPLMQDPFLAVLPENHPLTAKEKVSLSALCEEPFLLLERGSNTEIADLFKKHGCIPQVNFTTWDDYAIMAMAESGLGVGILPELILKRTPYRIAARKLDVPAYREIVLALRSVKNAPLVVKHFLGYLNFRDSGKNGTRET